MLEYLFQSVKLPVAGEAHVHWWTLHGCQGIRNQKHFIWKAAMQNWFRKRWNSSQKSACLECEYHNVSLIQMPIHECITSEVRLWTLPSPDEKTWLHTLSRQQLGHKCQESNSSIAKMTHHDWAWVNCYFDHAGCCSGRDLAKSFSLSAI